MCVNTFHDFIRLQGKFIVHVLFANILSVSREKYFYIITKIITYSDKI